MKSLALASGLLVWVACHSGAPVTGPSGGSERRRVDSNVLRGDYAGSDSCASCHAEIYGDWEGSPMRNMTRLAKGADIKAAFEGEAFDFMGDSARLERIDGERHIRLKSKYGDGLFRVTKVIGGRYREDFVGIEVDSTGHVVEGAQERVMPVSWLIFDQSHRYKGYSVMTPERPGLKPAGVWRQTCIFCHNTPPYLSTLYDDIHPEGGLGYQGAISDDLLPADRNWSMRVDDEDGLREALIAEIQLLHQRAFDLDDRDLPTLLRYAANSTRQKFDTDHLVEVGIGCELCHGGSKQHVEDPGALPTFEPRSPLVSAVVAEAGHDTQAGWINRTCRRCHTVLFSSYSFTWEGGLLLNGPGGSQINSGEARDFQLGGCVDKLSCTRCHDPHRADDPAAMARLQTAEGNKVCTGCHGELKQSAALAEHSHHSPAGAGGVCINCHMPVKNMGLTYKLTRYHRIASPNERAKVEKDRPVECALCHADRSVESLVGDMERWWGGQFDRTAIRQLYGSDLSINTLRATLAMGKPHEQSVALAVLGAARDPEAVEGMLDQLENRYPLIRHFAQEALESVTGRPLPLDMSLPAAELRKQAEAALGHGVAQR